MFTVSIEFGNDAMQTGTDVADALDDIARKLRGGYESGSVRDINGNTVGSWQLDTTTD